MKNSKSKYSTNSQKNQQNNSDQYISSQQKYKSPSISKISDQQKIDKNSQEINNFNSESIPLEHLQSQNMTQRQQTLYNIQSISNLLDNKPSTRLVSPLTTNRFQNDESSQYLNKNQHQNNEIQSLNQVLYKEVIQKCNSPPNNNLKLTLKNNLPNQLEQTQIEQNSGCLDDDETYVNLQKNPINSSIYTSHIKIKNVMRSQKIQENNELTININNKSVQNYTLPLKESQASIQNPDQQETQKNPKLVQRKSKKSFTQNSQSKLLDLEQSMKANGKSNKSKKKQNPYQFYKSIRVKNYFDRFILQLKVKSSLKGIQFLDQSFLDIIKDISFSSVLDSLKTQYYKDLDAKKTQLLKKRVQSQRNSIGLQNSSTFKAQMSLLISKNKMSQNIDAFSSKCSQFLDLLKIPLIKVGSTRLIWWEFFHVVLLLPLIFFIPIEVVGNVNMGDEFGHNTWQTYCYFGLVLLIIDMIIQFHTQIIYDGRIVEKKFIIFKVYLKKHFFIDLLCIACLISQAFDNENFKWLFILKIKQIFVFLNKILTKYISDKNIYNSLQLFHLFILTCCICHFLAICWWNVSTLQFDYDLSKETWVTYYELKNAHWSETYLIAFFFNCMTMTTVGYGNYLPQTKYEILFVIISMLFSSAVFAYTLTKIGEIIMDMNKGQERFKKEMSLINQFLDKRNINPQLRQEAINFIQYKYKSDKQVNKDEETIVINSFSDNLRDKMILNANIQIIDKCNLFKQYSQETKESLAMKLKEITIQENSIIFKEKEKNDDPLLYFIESGKIQIFFESNKDIKKKSITLQTLEENEYFGEKSFLAGGLRQKSARTIDVTTMFTISRNTFLNIIKQNRKDFEIFCMARDNLLIERVSFQQNITCKNCYFKGHFFNECPFLHLQLDKHQVILKEKFLTNERDLYNRNQKRLKFNTLDNQYFVKKAGRKQQAEVNSDIDTNSSFTLSNFDDQESFNFLDNFYKQNNSQIISDEMKNSPSPNVPDNLDLQQSSLSPSKNVFQTKTFSSKNFLRNNNNSNNTDLVQNSPRGKSSNYKNSQKQSNNFLNVSNNIDEEESQTSQNDYTFHQSDNQLMRKLQNKQKTQYNYQIQNRIQRSSSMQNSTSIQHHQLETQNSKKIQNSPYYKGKSKKQLFLNKKQFNTQNSPLNQSKIFNGYKKASSKSISQNLYDKVDLSNQITFSKKNLQYQKQKDHLAIHQPQNQISANDILNSMQMSLNPRQQFQQNNNYLNQSNMMFNNNNFQNNIQNQQTLLENLLQQSQQFKPLSQFSNNRNKTNFLFNKQSNLLSNLAPSIQQPSQDLKLIESLFQENPFLQDQLKSNNKYQNYDQYGNQRSNAMEIQQYSWVVEGYGKMSGQYVQKPLENNELMNILSGFKNISQTQNIKIVSTIEEKPVIFKWYHPQYNIKWSKIIENCNNNYVPFPADFGKYTFFNWKKSKVRLVIKKNNQLQNIYLPKELMDNNRKKGTQSFAGNIRRRKGKKSLKLSELKSNQKNVAQLKQSYTDKKQIKNVNFNQ